MKFSAHISQDDKGQWWYFPPSRPGVRTRVPVRVCENCHDEFVTTPRYGKSARFCSRQCSGYAGRGQSKGPSGVAHPGWKGGRRNVRGYVQVWAPDHHSIAGRGTTRKYVLEHRIVMEQKLGRSLLPTEEVHHLNGIKHDNRPENLELWHHSQPGGQRLSDRAHCPTCTCGAGVAPH